MDVDEVAVVMGAIGNHEETTGDPVGEVSAALNIADKADVHRSRVREIDPARFDIHDRVNYASQHSFVRVDGEARVIELEMSIDTKIAPLMDYFEIFLNRMIVHPPGGDRSWSASSGSPSIATACCKGDFLPGNPPAALAPRLRLRAPRPLLGGAPLYNPRGMETLGRLVVKVGTAVLTGDGADLDVARMGDLARQVAVLASGGTQVLLVSSGAIAAGPGPPGPAAHRGGTSPASRCWPPWGSTC